MGGSERYPDPSQFDQTLYDDILQLPNSQVIDISFIQQKVWSEAVDFSVPKHRVIRGMQANMFIIECINKEQEIRNVMVKRIIPKELPNKPSLEIWQGFVWSVRTEMAFYQELGRQENECLRDLFPRIYHSAGTPASRDQTPMDTSFSIVMEDLSQDYIQKPMMTEKEAMIVMDSLARLHAHFWGVGAEVERGSFWVLQRREAFGEVESADQTWNSFVDRFPELESLHPKVRDIGVRMAGRAEELDRSTEAGAITRIHGDAKGWNFFFAKEDSDKKRSQPFLLIDMQWTGRGHPLQDVAYALTTSLSEEALERMDSLVDHYFSRLKARLEQRGHTEDLGRLRMEYDTVWLDYARVVVTGLWKRLDKDSLERNKAKIGPSMINRSMKHVIFITQRLCRLLL